MVRLLPGTNIQKCRAINLESSWLVCLHCLCSSTEDVERRWGHLRELPGSLRWHWNFMVSGFDWYFLIHVFHSVEGVFKQGSLSHSVKQCWPNWGGERLCCRDMAGPRNKKPFCFSEQKGRCISNFGGAITGSLRPALDFYKGHILSQSKLLVLFSRQLFCRVSHQLINLSFFWNFLGTD